MQVYMFNRNTFDQRDLNNKETYNRHEFYS